MATDKPRFSITVSDDVYKQINDYQHEHRLATQTKAVLAFIEKGLEVVQKEKELHTRVIDGEPFQSCQGENDLFPDDINPDAKKSPSTAEAAPGDEISRIFDALNDMLVSEGLIKDGSDITEGQAEILLAVCQIIDATFKN